MTGFPIATAERETMVLRRLVAGQPIGYPMHLSGHPAEDGVFVVARYAQSAEDGQITHLVAGFSLTAEVAGAFRWVVNDWQFVPGCPRTLWLAPNHELGIEEVWCEDTLETGRLRPGSSGVAEAEIEATSLRRGA